MMKLLFASGLLFASAFAVRAQEYRGTISGLVTDPSSAVIAGAKVTVTEVNTGARMQATSESKGQYTAPFLLPGDYSITVQAQGFREAVRKGIHLGAGDHTVIDFRLDVGDA